MTFCLPARRQAAQAAQGEEISAQSICTLGDAQRMFQACFPSLLALDKSLPQQYMSNPIGKFRTITPERYHHGTAVLIGDAAHSMGPFLGQAMNLALEDAAVLAQQLRSGMHQSGSGHSGQPQARSQPRTLEQVAAAVGSSRLAEGRACQELTQLQKMHNVGLRQASALTKFRISYQLVMHKLLPGVFCPTGPHLL
jgi:2-polyprenyl-6-methoxyphenol hydroxylase-like FAD-dependent oxidoreductase